MTGNINRRELPYCVVIDGCNYMSVEAAEMVDRFRALMKKQNVKGTR